MGFRKTHSCAELVATLRLILDRRQEWRLPTRIAQIDFERACDSVHHAAICQSMKQKTRGAGATGSRLPKRSPACPYEVPTRDMEHRPDTVRRGLRQGCSASPMFFGGSSKSALNRFIASGATTAVAWTSIRAPSHMSHGRTTNASRSGVYAPGVAARADLETGLVLRWDKCSVAEVVHRDSPQSETEPPFAEFPRMAQTSLVADGTCMRVLGAVVQVGHDYADELNTIRKKCWAAVHARTTFWRVELHVLHKLRCCRWRFSRS